MVRIISQNFSPQRSRHSSGETDKYLADRASSAIGLGFSALGKKRLDLPECESSSDSFWDSEFDGEHHDAVYSECGEDNNDINGNETLKKSNAQSKRKERRRERNKISAQAYRQRRRSQNMKEQQELLDLETENKRLHQLVDTLQKETEQFKQSVRGQPGHPLPSPVHDTTVAACSRAPSTTTINLSNTHSPTTNSHSSPDGKEAIPFSPYSHSSAASPALPVMSNMNVSLSMPSPSHVLNENFASAASPSNAQATVAVSPLPNTQILVNANAVMKSHMQIPGAATTPPTFAVPALMAIPVECHAAAANFNLNSHPRNLNGKSHATLSMQSCVSQEKCPPLPTGSAPVVGTIMWSINGNPPPQATVYSLMNVEMCNNKNIGKNLNSNGYKQSVNGCDNSGSSAVPGSPVTVNGSPVTVNGSPVTVNLNEVQVTGEHLKFWHAH